jgi:hypothetical protein
MFMGVLKNTGCRFSISANVRTALAGSAQVSFCATGTWLASTTKG